MFQHSLLHMCTSAYCQSNECREDWDILFVWNTFSKKHFYMISKVDCEVSCRTLKVKHCKLKKIQLISIFNCNIFLF